MANKRDVIDLTSSKSTSQTAAWVDLTVEKLNPQFPSAASAAFDTPISGPSAQPQSPGLQYPSALKTGPQWYTTYPHTTQSPSSLSYFSPPEPAHQSMTSYYKEAAAAPPGVKISKFSYAKLPNYFDHMPVDQAPTDHSPGPIEYQHSTSTFLENVHMPQKPPHNPPVVAQQPKQIQEEVIDLETDKPALAHFGKTTLKRITCKDCKKSLISSEKDVSRLTKKWSNGELPMSSILVCPKDGGTTCAGCGKQKDGPRRFFRRTQKQAPQNINPTCSCEEGRLFLIWVLLCAAEHQKACNDRRDSYFSKSRSMSDPARLGSGARSRRHTSGTGYGDGGHGSSFGAFNMNPFNSSAVDSDFGMPGLQAHM
jgi:hypothetical protein